MRLGTKNPTAFRNYGPAAFAGMHNGGLLMGLVYLQAFAVLLVVLVGLAVVKLAWRACLWAGRHLRRAVAAWRQS